MPLYYADMHNTVRHCCFSFITVNYLSVANRENKSEGENLSASVGAFSEVPGGENVDMNGISKWFNSDDNDPRYVQ